MIATDISATRPATGQLVFPTGPSGLQQAACGRSSPRCPVCGSRMKYWGTGDYYGPGTPMFPAPLSRCCSCKAIRRDLPSEVITSHCDAASYTNLKNERPLPPSTAPFFEVLYSLAKKCAARPIATCLDFGSSYGHFLQILKGHGSDATGIEIVDTVRTSSQEKGLTVFKSLAEMTEHKMSQNFDLIAMIDSLYYVDDPRHTLRSMRRFLAKDGVLLLRFANRNWITWFLRRVCRKTHYDYWLGDAAIAYGRKSIQRLLADSGFSIVRWVYWEHGKTMSMPKRVLYAQHRW